ncbi:hypothetical protein NQ317_006353 [Molorchus minor]|uniref:Uncharacterized protein n=1 Tax=Molorchus minor TaxID=1323400 RepID=A0ABQ9JLQ5_9CUCU|nr:hypothetical protein NQ317_006353 [Molorchus minor]
MIANGQKKSLNPEKGKYTVPTILFNYILAEMETEEEFVPMHMYDWLIHLQHVRGETKACMQLIKRELERSNGRNEFALYKQIKHILPNKYSIYVSRVPCAKHKLLSHLAWSAAANQQIYFTSTVTYWALKEP